MSMSTHVVAFRDMDGEFARMLQIKRLCDESHVSYPKEVDVYFGNEAGEDEAYLRDTKLEVPLGDALKEWSEDSASGYEVEVSRIPSDVKTIRFSNSW